jgi:hypothetical protein
MSYLHKLFLALIALAVVGVSATGAKADVCSAVAGNLVVNCGFESGNFTGWTQSGNTTNSGVGNFGPGPNSGNFDAFFGPVAVPGFLSQTIVTTPGASYTVSFFLRNNNSAPPNSFSASFGGNLVTLTNNASFPYTPFTFSVVALGPSTNLQFSFQHDNSEWFLDDVSVTAVPEPATMLLLGTGLMGLTARIRRRSKRQSKSNH